MSANNKGSGKVLFEKGMSGNPSGRPKVPESVKTMLKASTVDAARKLIDTMNNSKDEKLAVDCAKTILDRVYGKATQAIEVGNKDDKAFEIKTNFDKLSVEELSELELLIARAVTVEELSEVDNESEGIKELLGVCEVRP